MQMAGCGVNPAGTHGPICALEYTCDGLEDRAPSRPNWVVVEADVAREVPSGAVSRGGR